MESAFAQLKEALSAECELYIPSADDEYGIHVDACDHGVGAVLKQRNPEGEWKPLRFFQAQAGTQGWEGTKSLEHPRARDLCISLLVAKN